MKKLMRYALTLANESLPDSVIRELDKDILVLFAFSSMGQFHALTVDYSLLSKDFTEYINHWIYGENLRENNFCVQLMAKKCTPSILKNLNVFVDSLRQLYPIKTFKDICIFEQGGQHSECVSYLMNIGGSGYSGVYCKVMDCDGQDPIFEWAPEGSPSKICR